MTGRVAVVGGGWAGLAAAVRAAEAGHRVTLFEMARQLGGRARSVERDGERLDNGQHILIGAYARTLDLMRRVGVDPDAVLTRTPLTLVGPDGQGLRLPPGHPILAFARGVLAHSGWGLADRLALLYQAARWSLAGFACPPGATVADLCAGLPPTLKRELIDPLCVAALNTAADAASGTVFLRVLRDALFGGPGAADLLLPRRPLGELLPEPAEHWLRTHAAAIRLGVRVQTLQRADGGWRVDDGLFDAVVVACSAAEAARLLEPLAPAWAAGARALHYEPIVTVTVDAPQARWPAPMLTLPGGPAQFGFDHGALGATPGRFTFVISDAAAWIEAGLPAAEAAVLAQLRDQFPLDIWPQAPRALATLAERRATFRCTPGLERPAASIAPGLAVAGDYVAGPYPATLEGAVRAGEAACALVLS